MAAVLVVAPVSIIIAEVSEVVAPPLLVLTSVPALHPEAHPLEVEAGRWDFQVLRLVLVRGIVDRLQCMYQEALFIRTVVFVAAVVAACGATPAGHQIRSTLEGCDIQSEAFLCFILHTMSFNLVHPVNTHHNGRISSVGTLSIHNTS